jgi:hypothetical protein
MISIHRLTGIQSSSNKTMQLFVVIDTMTLTVFLDSGSTDNFIDAATAERSDMAF